MLRFLGGTEVTDYMGPVGAKDSQPEIATELWRALLARDDWSGADLRGLAEDRSWLALLRESATAEGLRVEETEDQNGVAPFLELSPSWDAYLEGLPAKLRHEIKRKAKKLEAEAGEFRIVSATAETLEQFLDRFVELHRMSEGPKGVFMQPGMEIFFRRLGEAFLPGGVFRLSFIDVGGVWAAGTIGFAYGGTFSLYNSAFDREWQQLAPGWCWSVRTSGWRSRTGATPSICSRATTRTSIGSARAPGRSEGSSSSASSLLRPRRSEPCRARTRRGAVTVRLSKEARLVAVTSQVEPAPSAAKVIGQRSTERPSFAVNFAVTSPTSPGARTNTRTQD